MEKLRNPITLRFMAAEKGWWGGEEVEWAVSVPPSSTRHPPPPQSRFLTLLPPAHDQLFTPS